MPEIAIVNGVETPLAEATVSLLDLGLLRGMAVFETLRTYGGGRPYALEAHLERLWEGAALIGLEPVFTPDEARDLCRRGYLASGLDEVRLVLLLTPGPNVSGRFDSGHPTVALMVRELGVPAPEAYEHGISAVTFAAQRELAKWKTTNYLVGREGLKAAAVAGAQEAFYTTDGYVTEGVTSNVLVIADGAIHAPIRDALPGITRQGVQAVAARQGIPWMEEPVSVQAVYDADEVWICSSVRELLPVVKVDDAVIGDGTPGPVGQQLLAAFRAHCLSSALRDVS